MELFKIKTGHSPNNLSNLKSFLSTAAGQGPFDMDGTLPTISGVFLKLQLKGWTQEGFQVGWIVWTMTFFDLKKFNLF